MALRLTRALLTRAQPPTTIALPTKPKKKTTILEVERKFPRLAVPSLTNLPHNNPTQYTPPFTSVLPLPTKTIHDIYYDTPHHQLCAAGAWVRRRNGTWEAKVRKGGDFVNSRFEELTGVEEIGRCVRHSLGSGDGEDRQGEEDNFGLEKMAEFVTTREGWVVDGEFRVVRDRMDFGHEVGEVELQVEVVAEGLGDREKGVLMEEMDKRIGEFMERYKWAWEKGRAVGKLTAYFEMVERKKGE